MTLEILLVFFEIQGSSSDDQCIIKSCYMPGAMLNSHVHNNPSVSTTINIPLSHYFSSEKWGK